MRNEAEAIEAAGECRPPEPSGGRRVRAGRVALLHDGAAYFAAARSALARAQSSITLLGWSFDPRVRLLPTAGGAASEESLADLLRRLKAERPDLAIRLLIWDMPWPISAGTEVTPEAIRAALGPGIDYRVDGCLPFGACQHQKVLLVDDRIAFCGGSDFETNRWDTPAHRDRDPRRRLPTGEPYPPRHDVMMLIDGAAAGALAEIARERWLAATGERLTPAPAETDPWPDGVMPLLEDVAVTVARTLPGGPGRPALRESEALYRAQIRAARRVIYLENQYLTSPVVADALAERLAEPDGPEIVVVLAERSPNRFDRLTMDGARRTLLGQLRAADAFDRFRVLAPRTAAGRPVLVHAKVAIFDDRMLRVGSTNLNNRSLGYDSECDLAVEVSTHPRHAASRAAVARVLHGLLAHHAHVPLDAFEAAVRARGSLRAVLDDAALVPPERLCPLVASRRGLVARLIEAWHLGDPTGRSDAWRPWRRRSALRRAQGAEPSAAGQERERAA